MLLVGFGLLRGAAIGGLSLVSQHVINLWFVQRRGIAAAASSLGLAAGSTLLPPLFDLPEGCAFAPRCSKADDHCRRERPAYEQKRTGHWAACWHSNG